MTDDRETVAIAFLVEVRLEDLGLSSICNCYLFSYLCVYIFHVSFLLLAVSSSMIK